MRIAQLFNVVPKNLVHTQLYVLVKTVGFLGKGGHVIVLGIFYDVPLSSLFNKDDKKAIFLLEQSSRAGCLQSSYLLWEHSRKSAVSLSVSS